MTVPPKELLDRLAYDPTTGEFRWKRSFPGRAAGTVAGCVRSDGYVRIVFRKVEYPGHQLAWAIGHGSWPNELLDHRNGDRSDNRLQNLRLASPSQNSANRVNAGTMTSRFKGVTRTKSGRWIAYCGPRGTNRYLGTFEAEIDAARAYQDAALAVFGEFASAAPSLIREHA